MIRIYVYILFLNSQFLIYGQVDSLKEYYHNPELKIKEYDNVHNHEREGLVRVYYNNGQLESEKNYRYGKINGFVKSYHDNGQLASEGAYKDNKRKGFWKFYYKNGQIKKRANYRYGKLRGYFKSYYESGYLQSEGNYIDIEELSGLWKFYYPNGELKEEHIYINQVLVSKILFKQNDKETNQIPQEFVRRYNPLIRPSVW